MNFAPSRRPLRSQRSPERTLALAAHRQWSQDQERKAIREVLYLCLGYAATITCLLVGVAAAA